MGPRGYPTAFQPGARRLEGGGRPSYIVMPMLVAALRLVAQQLTTRRIAARLGEMASLVAAQARDAAERPERGGREAAERRPRRCGPRRGGREES